jgi:hypothetical protein
VVITEAVIDFFRSLFSPGVCTLLNADRISSLQENWALYQGTTSVVPKPIENMSGF